MNQYKKCAIYVRVSTEKQEAENQLIDLRRYAKQRGWSIFKEYVDIISGKERSRPAFDQLFQDAHKLLFDVVLFWDLSRFSRAGMKHTIDKLAELENNGISWVSFNEPYVSTENELARNVVLAVLSSIAKAEREKISDRTKAGIERARKQGKIIGRPTKKTKYRKKRTIELYKKYGSIRRVSKEMRDISYGTVYEILEEAGLVGKGTSIKNRGGFKTPPRKGK